MKLFITCLAALFLVSCTNIDVNGYYAKGGASGPIYKIDRNGKRVLLNP